jgi:AcrR family transcriptional regulator
MQKQSSSETTSTSEIVPTLLTRTVPIDIGVQAQRRRIIDAMVASCAAKTYAATTISDVVSAASISRTTFYKRFDDKRECFDAALDHCIEEVHGVIAASVSDADSTSEVVRKSSAAMLEFLAARPELANLLAAEAVAVDPTVTARYRELVIPTLEGLWGEGFTRNHRISPGLAFGRAQLLIFSQVVGGRAQRLPELQPEIVYLASAPFTGHDEAARQARLAVEDTATNRSPAVGG